MVAPKHIVVITTSFPDGEPGREAAGSFVEDFAEAVAGHCKVTVVAPGRGQSEEEDRGTLSIRRYHAPPDTLSHLVSFNPLNWMRIAAIHRAGGRLLNRLAGEGRIDYLLALWTLPSGYWARETGKRFGIPYGVWALGSDIWSLKKIPFVRGFLSGVLRESRNCFADGYLLGEDVERLSGRGCHFLASARCLPVGEEKKLSEAPPFRFAFLGRWHPNKGVDLLMESLKLLGEDDWKRIEAVRICGGGPLEAFVREGSAALKEAGRPVHVEGYKDKAAAADLLRWADYLFLPSRIESIPVVFSDAMQARCPVIAMPVGDLPRLIGHDGPGLLAGNVGSEDFCWAIQCALEKTPWDFSRGMKKMRAQFNVPNTAERFLSLIG